MTQLRFSRGLRRAAHLFANMPIRRRVALVGLVPGVAAMTLAGGKLVSDYGVWTQGNTAAAEIAAAGQVGMLVHELQRERGLTISMLAGRDPAIAAPLAEQRQRVDSQRKVLALRLAELGEESSEDAITDGIDSLVNRLCNIASLRRDIDARTIAPEDASAYYTAPIGDYIDYVEHAGRSDASAVLRDRLVGFSALLRAKEEAGRERGLGAGLIASGAIDGEARATLAALGAAQDTYLAMLAQHASPALNKGIAALQTSQANRAALGQREALLSASALSPAAGPKWWEATTRRIDAMQAVAITGEKELIALAGAEAARARLSFFLFVIALLGFGAMLTGLVLMVVRGLVAPIQALALATEKMTAGDLDVELAVAETEEEIGQLAARIRQFRDQLLQAERERIAHAEERERQIARVEDRARRVDALTGRFDGEVGTVLASFASSTSALLDAARELDRKALESAQRSAAVASASQQTNANVRLVAEATEELSLSIEEIVRQVTTTAAGMSAAVAEVRRAHGDMAILRQAANEIGSIVTLIGDIAEQTNILALNATIEAARAGSEGYGFAVVAAEVRALATQTGEATRSIAGSIAEVTGKTRTAAEGMDRIAETIRTAEAASTAISAALEQQSVAARQIAENVQEAACGVAQVDSNIVAIEQASSAQRGEVEGVVGAAGLFGERASSLDASVQDFLSSIRAA